MKLRLLLPMILLSAIGIAQPFTEVTSVIFPGMYGDADWGDYNNDGYLDLVLTGTNQSGSRYTAVFRNDGGTGFTEQTTILLDNLSLSYVAWGDYDNDAYLNFPLRHC